MSVAIWLETKPHVAPKRVRLDHHRADTNLVEERPLRKREVVFTPPLDAETNEVVNQHRIRVAIATNRMFCDVAEHKDARWLMD